MTVRNEIYRIAREALTNAFRHSEASKIEIELTYDYGNLQIVIRDDGIGIAQEVLSGGRTGHWGLSGMRERAQQIGARLTVWSRPGAGTEVDLNISSKLAYLRDHKKLRQRWIRAVFKG